MALVAVKWRWLAVKWRRRTFFSRALIFLSAPDCFGFFSRIALMSIVRSLRSLFLIVTMRRSDAFLLPSTFCRCEHASGAERRLSALAPAVPEGSTEARGGGGGARRAGQEEDAEDELGEAGGSPVTCAASA